MLETIHADSVSGVVIEFGVSTGKSLERIVTICEEIGLKRPIFGFDSFEGLPEPSADDPVDRYWVKGAYAADLDTVRRKLKVDQRPYLKLVKGWFRDALPTIQAEIPQVAFARIDCDLYEPTADCLQFLVGRLSHGSVVYFDDWLHRRMQGETKAFFEFTERMKAQYRFEYLASFCVGSLAVRVWHRDRSPEA